MVTDKITEFRTQHATTTLEELEALKVAGLRTIGSEVGIRQIEREGEPIPINRARKAELTIAIYQACEAYRRVELPVEAPAAPVELAEGEQATEKEYFQEIIESEYPDRDGEEIAIAEKYYSGQYNSATKAWDFVGLRECVARSDSQGVAFVPEFFTLVATLKPELEMVCQRRSRSVNVEEKVILKWRSVILKRIEKLVDRDNDFFPDDLLAKTFSHFSRAVKATFLVESKASTVATNTNLNLRQNDALDIQVAPLIKWAIEQVTNLPENPARWREVALALMILTGRRQSEIMSSAKFALSDQAGHLFFSGQLKRHAGDLVEDIEIPILGKASYEVMEAMAWLERNGKRLLPKDDSFAAQQEAAKRAHDRFGRYISERAKDLFELVGKAPEKSWFLTDESGTEIQDKHGKLKDRRKAHLFRQIYAQVAVGVFYPHTSGGGRKPRQIISKLMGHADSPSSRKHSTESYDSDVFVTDIEEVKALSSQRCEGA